MAIEKEKIVDWIEVAEIGCVQVRTATRIIDEGVVIANSVHRHIITPGDDYSQEDARVQAICAAVHTPEVIAEYQAQLAANQPIGA